MTTQKRLSTNAKNGNKKTEQVIADYRAKLLAQRESGDTKNALLTEKIIRRLESDLANRNKNQKT